MLRQIFASSVLALLATPVAAAPAFYSLGQGNYGSGVSSNGSVVSGYGGAGFFYWTPGGGVVDIGGHSPALGDGAGGSSAISEDGNYLGGNTDDPNTQLSEMSRYHIPTASWQLLGGIGGSSGVESSSAWGISGNGQSVVGLGWVNGGTAHAIQWNSPGPTQDLGSTSPGQSSRANAANYDGSVVVGWQDGDNGRQGAIWDNGTQTLIFNNADPVNEASDVSSDGNWVVGQSGFGTSDQAWRYNRSNGQLDLLGVIDPNAFFVSRGATGVSDDGRIVVGFERDFFNPFGGSFGTIWIEGQGIQDITPWALAQGVPLPVGVSLTIPLAISADGLTISGIDSQFNGFVITVPEPGTFAMLVPLAIVSIRRRRRA